MWRWLTSRFTKAAPAEATRREGREVLQPGEHPPRTCPKCGSSRLMLAQDIVADAGVASHVRDIVFCERCGREWELASSHERGSAPRPTTPSTRGPTSLEEVFGRSAVVRRSGGVLDIGKLRPGPREVFAAFLGPAQEYLAELHVLRNRVSDSPPRWHMGIIATHNVNAVAFADGPDNLIGINGGTVACLFASSMALFGLPSFLPDVGNAQACGRDRRALDTHENLIRSVLSNGRLDWTLRFDAPADETRTEFAFALFLMATKLVWYHELGHLQGGHIELLRGRTGRAELVELRAKGDSGPPRELSHMMEVDADDFAAGHYTTVLSLARDAGTAELGDGLQTLETMHFLWALAAALVFRVFAGGLTLDPVIDFNSGSDSHPHPAIRLALIRHALLDHRFHDIFIPQTRLERALTRADVGLNRTLENLGATPIWADGLLKPSQLAEIRERHDAFRSEVAPLSFQGPDSP